MLFDAEHFDVSRCHGCGLCAMVCPVYQQGGNVMMTPHGLAKASQYNGRPQRDDVFACMLCGACSPLCPQDIDLMQMLVAMRRLFDDGPEQSKTATGSMAQKGRTVLIADKRLREDQQRLDRVLHQLRSEHVQLAVDQGSDIGEAMHAGRAVSHGRVHEFLTTLQPVKKIIISDGLLQLLIGRKLPQIPMQSLGQTLSSRKEVRRQMNVRDFYMMDSQSYHASYADSLPYYDRLQQETSCQLNRDLHRLGIPSGALANDSFDRQAQVEWLLQGHDIDRVIVESLADYLVLSAYGQQPVQHISDLLA